MTPIWRRLDMHESHPASLFADRARVRVVETTTRVDIWVLDEVEIGAANEPDELASVVVDDAAGMVEF